MKKDKIFYIDSANAILARLDHYLNNLYKDTPSYSLDDIMSETELLFYSFAKDYPALYDLKTIKERCKGREWDFQPVISRVIKSSIERFIDFQENHTETLVEHN